MVQRRRRACASFCAFSRFFFSSPLLVRSDSITARCCADMRVPPLDHRRSPVPSGVCPWGACVCYKRVRPLCDSLKRWPGGCKSSGGHGEDARGVHIPAVQCQQRAARHSGRGVMGWEGGGGGGAVVLAKQACGGWDGFDLARGVGLGSKQAPLSRQPAHARQRPRLGGRPVAALCHPAPVFRVSVVIF